MRERWPYLFVLSGIALFVIAAAAAKTVPVKREHLAQAWIGMSSDSAYVYRLELHLNGKGLGAFLFQDEQPCAFRIARWFYERGSVSFELGASPNECTAGRKFTAIVRGSATMELTMSGKGWKEHCLLRPEASYLAHLQTLRDLMGSM